MQTGRYRHMHATTPFPQITSTRNRQIQQVLRLRRRAQRRQQGHTLIEGEQEIRRAMANRIPFHAVYVCPPMADNEDARLLVQHLRAYVRKHPAAMYAVSEHVYQRLAMRSTVGGVIAEARFRTPPLRDLQTGPRARYVVLEDADRPGNIGGVLRTLHAVGATALLLASHRDTGTDMANPGVIRASLGTVFDVPSAQARSPEIISWLRRQECAIITAEPDGRNLYGPLAIPAKAAFVFGSETAGLSPLWREAAHARIAIPMLGQAVDSLNLAVSVAVVMYEFLRRAQYDQIPDIR